MLRRTIVSIEEDAAGGLTSKLVRAELDIPDARKPTPFQVDLLPPLDSPQHVQEYGRRLHDALALHPAIQAALLNIAQTPAGQRRTLCFEILAAPGEQIRWETLTDEQGKFVALSGRCQLGRIADDVSNHDTGVRVFTPPLRIAAFLSAAGINAEAEWTALAEAVAAAQKNGLAVELRAYLGEQNLLDDAQSAKGAGSLSGVTVQPLPASPLEVAEELDDWLPHIVHFFCHGATGFGLQYLELATVVDHDTGQATGSILLDIDQLVEIQGIRESWLVVLNCCLGGQAPERLSSMAHRLVAAGGVPAAIGMQEPVEVGDANAFCANLYPPLFDLLHGVVDTPKAMPVPVDLTVAVGRPRQALRDKNATNPAAFARWTLPVLYLHREPLQVQQIQGVPVITLDALKPRIDLVANMLRSLPPDTPQELRENMLAILDQPPVVPKSMRPNLEGQFPAAV